MVATPAYTIFVNSTDSFKDTWVPFFHLLKEYWPQANTIVLNTETEDFSRPDLSIVCTHVARPGETRIPWGECMIRALDHIPTEVFLYLQDDYFLYEPVMVDRVDEACRIMSAEGLDCLRLVECGGSGPWESTEYPWIWSLSRHAAYRISLQAGLWTKTGMRKYLREHETPWQMEIFGSKRAMRVEGRIWCVSRDVYGDDQQQVIPYVPTGIVKGRWNRSVVEALFRQHGIEVPFEVRGWWDKEASPRSNLRARLRKLPKSAWDRIRSL